jgi:hypothetical protein
MCALLGAMNKILLTCKRRCNIGWGIIINANKQVLKFDVVNMLTWFLQPLIIEGTLIIEGSLAFQVSLDYLQSEIFL